MLAPFERRDFDAIVRLFTDPVVRRYLGGPVDIAMATTRAQALYQRDRYSPAWAIRREAGNAQLLGIVTLHPHHDKTDSEVSFLLLPEHWGRGYATQAVRSALDHAFQVLTLDRVVAETQIENFASIRVLERTGMSLLRNVVRFGDAQVIYARAARTAIFAA